MFVEAVFKNEGLPPEVLYIIFFSYSIKFIEVNNLHLDAYGSI